MIGVTRRIMDNMLLNYGSNSLTHEVLTTFLAEASSIINSRPLVPVSSDPEMPYILSPSMLLTQKTGTNNIFVMDANTDPKDLLRKQWKRVQHLAAHFWKRWKVEYLNTLQNRRKWLDPQRNVTPGDIVLLRDKELTRIDWPMGVVLRVIPSEDDLVRKVEVHIAKDGPRTFIHTCRTVNKRH